MNTARQPSENVSSVDTRGKRSPDISQTHDALQPVSVHADGALHPRASGNLSVTSAVAPMRAPVHLQQTLGNQAMLRRMHSGLDPSSIHGAYSHQPIIGNRGLTRRLQAKLKVNAPGDQYEQEADRVAEQVVRMPEARPAMHAVTTTSLHVQRKCSCGGTCSKCQGEQSDHDHEHLQMKSAGPNTMSGIAAPPIVHEVLRSPGQPLDPTTRAFMEPRLGHDFSNVRIHADDQAAESARLVNANAYTVGRDVIFDAGQFSPSTDRGRKVLAHELAHVVQQRHGAGNVAPGGAQEREAGEVEETATRYHALVNVTQVSGVGIARQPKGGDRFDFYQRALYGNRAHQYDSDWPYLPYFSQLWERAAAARNDESGGWKRPEFHAFVDAVAAFQKNRGMAADGVVDGRIQAALKEHPIVDIEAVDKAEINFVSAETRAAEADWKTHSSELIIEEAQLRITDYLLTRRLKAGEIRPDQWLSQSRTRLYDLWSKANSLGVRVPTAEQLVSAVLEAMQDRSHEQNLPCPTCHSHSTKNLTNKQLKLLETASFDDPYSIVDKPRTTFEKENQWQDPHNVLNGSLFPVFNRKISDQPIGYGRSYKGSVTHWFDINGKEVDITEGPNVEDVPFFEDPLNFIPFESVGSVGAAGGRGIARGVGRFLLKEAEQESETLLEKEVAGGTAKLFKNKTEQEMASALQEAPAALKTAKQDASTALKEGEDIAKPSETGGGGPIKIGKPPVSAAKPEPSPAPTPAPKAKGSPRLAETPVPESSTESAKRIEAIEQGAKEIADEGLQARFPTADGGEIKITKDGKFFVCASPCEEFYSKYGKTLEANNELLTKFRNIETEITDPKKQAEALAALKPEVEAAAKLTDPLRTAANLGVEGATDEGGLIIGRLSNGAEVAVTLSKAGDNLAVNVVGVFNPAKTDVLGSLLRLYKGAFRAAKAEGAVSVTLRGVAVVNKEIEAKLIEDGWKLTKVKIGEEIVDAFERTFPVK